jgi:hypothetical protein
MEIEREVGIFAGDQADGLGTQGANKNRHVPVLGIGALMLAVGAMVQTEDLSAIDNGHTKTPALAVQSLSKSYGVRAMAGKRQQTDRSIDTLIDMGMEDEKD